MPPVVSLTFAAALALINLWLGWRVGELRRALRISTGDGGDPRLVARMRAQANFVEYVPLTLILMMLVELSGGGRRGLWLLGVLLVVARLVHPFGMEAKGVGRLRTIGFGLNGLVLLVLVGWALYRAWLITHVGGVGVPVVA